MRGQPPESTLMSTLFPYTTLFRSDMPLLKRDRERGYPLLLCAARLEVAAAQLFEPDKTENLQRQPHCEPRVALFSQHFDIARMIGARLFLLDRGFGFLRLVAVIGGRRLHDAHAFLDIGVESPEARRGWEERGSTC